MKRFKHATIWDNEDGRVFIFLSDDIERMDSTKHELRCHRNTLRDAIETARDYVAPINGTINQLLRVEAKNKYRQIKQVGQRFPYSKDHF